MRLNRINRKEKWFRLSSLPTWLQFGEGMIDSYGNEIWEQQELFTCSWGVNSGFKHHQEELDCLVPFQGMCENPRTKTRRMGIGSTMDGE